MHLLLVEDNPPEVVLVREALKQVRVPIELSAVSTGTQALAFLHHHPPYVAVATPHLVLLDLNLPQKTGHEVLAELHHDPELQYLPVVVLTSSSEPEDINQCYELGANAYLVKPLELEPFLTLMKNTVMFWGACQFRTLKD
jgi:two-component system, chemotaxis family, response regulator Rcp1